jgi:hypothetical protein
MTFRRSVLLGILALIAAPFFADAEDVTERATQTQPAVQAPADATALMRALLADGTIEHSIGLAENAYDFNAAGTVPGSGPLENGERRVARVVGE